MIRALGALDTVIEGIEDLQKYVSFFKIRLLVFKSMFVESNCPEVAVYHGDTR